MTCQLSELSCGKDSARYGCATPDPSVIVNVALNSRRVVATVPPACPRALSERLGVSRPTRMESGRAADAISLLRAGGLDPVGLEAQAVANRITRRRTSRAAMKPLKSGRSPASPRQRPCRGL